MRPEIAFASPWQKQLKEDGLQCSFWKARSMQNLHQVVCADGGDLDSADLPPIIFCFSSTQSSSKSNEINSISHCFEVSCRLVVSPCNFSAM